MDCLNGIMNNKYRCKSEMDDCSRHDESFMRPTEYSEREKYVKETKVITTWHKEPSECYCNRDFRG